MKAALPLLLLIPTLASAVARDAESLLLRELRSLTGKAAKSCGTVRLGSDYREAWACAQSAQRGTRPFWVAIQRRGTDSQMWVASLRDLAGDKYILYFDSNYKGSGGLLPRFTREACKGTVEFAPEQPQGLYCGK